MSGSQETSGTTGSTETTESTEDKLRRYLRRTAGDLEAVSARLRETEYRAGEPIAVVGMGCRFPGGIDGPAALWDFLVADGDAVSPAPAGRGWDSAALDGCTGGFLHDAAGFDADFFGISPREALAMDPQQRLLLEVAWEALERAGFDPAALGGTATGVFAGVGAVDYGPRPDEAAPEVLGYLGTGTASSVASGRVAYTLGLEGPALTVDTACSSSLTATHLAMQSLRRGECTTALAGGATVMSTAGAFTEFRAQGGLAADGRCKPFAEAADGFALAEGVGFLVLQRLSTARREGRRVLAVLRGSAVNQDGASNGLTAPNGPAQQRVIRQALEDSGLGPADVDYVEAHGTGTTLGDPIEAHALLAAYGAGRPAHAPLWIGSVKANIGHTQAAAGVAGLIKTVLALQHGRLPRLLHFDAPSSRIDWESGAVVPLAESRPWPRGGRTRRAGVSSFGISGTNAHIIVEEAPKPDPEPDPVPEAPAADRETGPYPILLSGRGEEALRAQAERLAAHLERPGADPLPDVSFTLATRRTAFPHRAVVVGGPADVPAALRAVAREEPHAQAVTGTARAGRRIVMVFPGQGSQWEGMAAGLLAASPVFARSVRECEQALAPYVDWSLTEVLAGGAPLERVDVVQPALFAVMVSLAALWRAHGVEPDAVIGHSQGEIAAACVAGALSLQDAAKVVAVRAKALRSLAGSGGMVSLARSPEQTEALLARYGGALTIASVNGPDAVVVAGPRADLDALLDACAADGVRARNIPVDYASHSPMVEPLRAELTAALSGVVARTAPVPLYSTTTGAPIDTALMDGDYWYRNLRETVRFETGTRLLAEAGFDTFVEVSPQPVLATGIEATLEAAGADAAVLSTLRRGAGGPDRFLTALGEAHVRGVQVDWSPALSAGAVTELPCYPFQHRPFWHTAPGRRAEPAGRERRYRVRWHDAGWAAAPLTGRVLLVTGRRVPDAWYDTVRAALQDAGATVGTVDCDAPERAVTAAALRAATAAGEPAAVVSLLALDTAGESADDTAGESAAAPHLLAWRTLSLIQALGDAGVEAPLWVLTRRAVAVTEQDGEPDPAQTAVAGLGRAAGLEHPARWGGSIDLPAPDRDLLARLPWVLADPRDEDQVALRASGDRVPRLVPAPADAPAGADGWRPGGTALVTGGTGGLGAHVARRLARAGATRLVLTSRQGPNAPGAESLRAELTALGAQVTLAACDVTDRAALAALIDAERAHGRAIDAVFHTAGVPQSTPLEAITEEEFTRVTAAKITGTAHLDELCPDADTFVLFSSNAGVWGASRAGAYAAANAFLDGFAHRRRRRGLPALSVAWGLWDGPGMAGDAGQDFLRRQGMRPLPPEQALAELGTCLAGAETCVSVADLDRRAFLDLMGAVRHRPLFDELARTLPAAPSAGEPREEPEGRSRLRDKLLPLPAGERREHLLRLVRAEAAAVLGHADAGAVDRDRAFRELGFDSMSAVQLRNRITAATGLREATTLVFDRPSVTALADYLLDRLFGSEEIPADGAESAAGPAGPAAQASGGSGGDGGDDPVVIVGMACRLPGGIGSPEDLWEFVAAGRDAVAPMPADRGWDLDLLGATTADGASGPRHGAFLDDAAGFDAAFFGISPREALAMDPQQRQVLEATWEAMENSGIDPRALRGSDTGVFLGAAYQGYGHGAETPESSEGYLLTGGSPAVASGRVAYVLGLEGPALTVDTACSSSLVALHLAARSLRDGECSLAVAGGVSVMAGPEVFTEFSRQGALAADGRCKAYSDDADGFGFAEGVALLVLERLSQARQRGHRVLAVVRGSAVNQDGASNGLAAPSGPAQQRVIRRAWQAAGISGADVDVVEGHGTGTALGDPIEAQALLATYGQGRDPGRPLWLGSVKSNIGHAQAAAGAVGVIKMVLALGRGVLPGSLHAGVPSSHVDWSSGGVRVLGEARAWPSGGRVRRAGVSAFGVSGTNAHVIVEEAPSLPVEAGAAGGPVGVLEAAGVVPLVVSARTETALAAQSRRLLPVLDDDAPDPDTLDRVGRTLATGRTHHEQRAVVLAEDTGMARDLLHRLAEGLPAPGLVTGVGGGGRRVVWVFPGQGSQWVGMGRGLLDVPVFAQALAECDAALAEVAGFSVVDVVRGVEGAPGLDRVEVVQPVLFAVMVSLARLWRACGVEPDAVVGHSQGEIAAACVAGALSLPDAARVVALRAQALAELAGPGAMTSVALPEDRARELIAEWPERVSVAAVNSPASVVVAGDPEALTAFEERCAADGIRARRIPVGYASHSPHMERLRRRVRTDLTGVTPRPTGTPLYSTLRGERCDTGTMDAAYWYDNLRSPVRFEAAVRAAVEDGYDTFVEVSPHPVLTTSVQETAERHGSEVLVLGSLHRDEGERHFVRELARAHAGGVSVDWRAVFPDGAPARLPNYPFEHERYWLAPEIPDRVGDWRCRIEWRPLSPATDPLSGTYLVVGTGTGPQEDTLAGAVEDAGGTVLRLTADAVATGREELARTLREAAPGGVTAVVSLLALAADPSDPSGPNDPSGPDDELRAATAALTLHQALGDAGVEAPLWLVTRGAVAVGQDTADDTADPAQAMVWGIGRVMGLEAPGRWGGLLDLPGELTPSVLRWFTACLQHAGDEDQLALREGGCFVRRLVRAPLEPVAAPWQPAGTALVTGGTGALGGHVARHLARAGADHLVLVGRSGGPAPQHAELAAELTALGARVTFAACDVTDRARLTELIDGLRRQGEPVRTVMHLAGVPDGRALTDLDPDELARVTRVKTVGARLLDELCPDAETFVLFSSGAGLYGSGLLGAYAAGNAYLDALAHRRRAAGKPATSIAWGAWADGGMADADLPGLIRRGMRPMAPDKAVRALQQALDQRDVCVSIADIDWNRFAVGFTAARPRPLIEDLPDAARQAPAEPAHDGPGRRSTWPERLSGLPADEAEAMLATWIRAQVAAVLGHRDPDAVGLHQPFAQLGFDSLSAMGVRNRLQDATGLPLATTLVFDHPSVTDVAAYLRPLLTSETPHPAADGGGMLRGLYERSVQQGRFDSYLELLGELAGHRDHFTGPEDLAASVDLVELASGPGEIRLICVAGTAPVAGPHEFLRLAAAFEGSMPVSALPQPGYEPGEQLPASLAAVLGVQADAVLKSADGPFVLVGHSAGALMAHALGAELADRGRPPHGIVLIDVYPPGRQQAVQGWLAELTDTMFGREGVRVDDTRLTALGAYHRFTSTWQPRDLAVPTLLVRACEPLGEWPDGTSWQSTWPFPHTCVDVPGNHFSMVQEHAGAVAERIRTWTGNEA